MYLVILLCTRSVRVGVWGTGEVLSNMNTPTERPGIVTQNGLRVKMVKSLLYR